jgi:hypothetical protein
VRVSDQDHFAVDCADARSIHDRGQSDQQRADKPPKTLLDSGGTITTAQVPMMACAIISGVFVPSSAQVQ